VALKIERAASLVLETGPSGDLRAALQSVSEATTPDGAPRYAVKVCRTLNRLIACRAYAVSALQLCHFVNIAESCAPRRGAHEHLLMGTERATGAGFRGCITSAVADRGWRRAGCDVSGEGVVIQYSDAVFNVGFARMPLLAALFEFLCGTVGYASLDEEFCTMLHSPTSDDAVRAAANGIERLLYAYLKENLSSVQMQGKFQVLLEFARSDAAAPELVVDVTTILEFCREKSLDEDAGNFRLFRSAFDAYTAFLLALEVATDSEAVGRARAVGADWEAGEVDVAALLDSADSMDVWTSPLHAVIRSDELPEDDEGIDLQSGPLDQLAGHLDDTKVSFPDLGRLEEARASSRRAFKRISRRGFEDEALDNPEKAIEFETSADALAVISDQIHAFLRVSDSGGGEGTDLVPQFATIVRCSANNSRISTEAAYE
jgi:hypothetical protein